MKSNFSHFKGLPLKILFVFLAMATTISSYSKDESVKKLEDIKGTLQIVEGNFCITNSSQSFLADFNQQKKLVIDSSSNLDVTNFKLSSNLQYCKIHDLTICKNLNSFNDISIKKTNIESKGHFIFSIEQLIFK